jgi:sugar-specific transcriptional regulator TrmB
MLVRAIRLADKTILIETGDLGPRSVEHALCSDTRRGVDVEIVRDSADCDSHLADAGHQRPAVQCEPNDKVGHPADDGD